VAAEHPPAAEDPPLRERKRQQTRRAILEAAAEIELVGGGAIDPAAITYAHIAKVAGVSERTVYRFFPTKAELDAAYVAEQPLLLGLDPDPTDVSHYPDMIEELGRRWAERTGGARVDEHEVGVDEYPLSFAARRTRDAELVDRLMALAPDSDQLDPRQRRAIAAAVHASLSIRTIAITAQRWNLTIDEATQAHAWTGRVLLDAIASGAIEPWEHDHG